MKISKYTFLFDNQNNEFYAYNTLSNALLEIDRDSYSLLCKYKDGKNLPETEFDKE